MGILSENKKHVEKLNPKREIMECRSPWQNGLVEVEFATVACHTRAMCNAANMNDKIHILVANEVTVYSTSPVNTTR